MKPAVLGGIAFAVGLAASTGVVYARRGPAAAQVEADSTHAEPKNSTATSHSAAKGDSASSPVTPPDTAEHAKTEPSAAAHPTNDSSVAVKPTVPTHDSAARPAAVPAAAKPVQPDYPRLARILSAMPVANATELVGRLNDHDAEGILRSLGQRQAAAFLAALPKDRAAALSQRLLIPRDSTGGK